MPTLLDASEGVPLVVLINGKAPRLRNRRGALQDHKRGVLKTASGGFGANRYSRMIAP
jgi:hypothetical protein